MEQLTIEQEREILLAILNDKIDDCDNGSSRVVFLELGENTTAVLNRLHIPTNCVIKVNIGSAGCTQSHQERELFWRAFEDGRENLFATIYAYGKVIQIMEKLECNSFLEDVYYCCDSEDDHYYRPIHFYDRIDQIIKTKYRIEKDETLVTFDSFYEQYMRLTENMVTFLQDISDYTGASGDDYQVGFDSNGLIKSYDYGFTRQGSRKTHCFSGDYDSIACNVDYYIEEILHLDFISPDELEEIAQEMSWND